MDCSIVGGDSDGLFKLLNGSFGAPQLPEHQSQGIAGFCILRSDGKVLLVALNCQVELSLLVGNPAQDKQGTGVFFLLKYALANILGLLQAAFLEML